MLDIKNRKKESETFRPHMGAVFSAIKCSKNKIKAV